MCQFVDEGDLGVTSEYRIEIHLFKDRAPILDCFAWHDFQI